VLLSFRKQGGVVYLRLHRMFLHAPAAVCARWRAACGGRTATRTARCGAS
jgi:hypothetical protein